MKKSKLYTLLREPLLHFLLIGGLLFLLYDFQNENIVNDNHITISEAEIDRFILMWQKKRQRLPTQIELQGLIEHQIHEEVMYREALVMGLDKDDVIVKKRLAQKIEFISSDIADLIEPTDKELHEYLNTHSKKFETPAHLSFEHIYFNSDKRGIHTKADALSLLTQLKKINSGIDTGVDAHIEGDPFMMGKAHENLTEIDTSKLFGNEFSAELFSLDTGVWYGPIVSGYGLHLVRINNKVASKPAQLTVVKEKIRREWKSQRRRATNKALYENLRQRYDIVIESTSIKEKLTGTYP